MQVGDGDQVEEGLDEKKTKEKMIIKKVRVGKYTIGFHHGKKKLIEEVEVKEDSTTEVFVDFIDLKVNVCTL